MSSRPTEFRRGVLACTGIEFCKLALVETKARARTVVEELERRLPEWDSPLSIHVNGCPNSCARFQVADVGLKSLVMTDESGESVEGSRSTSAAAWATTPSWPATRRLRHRGRRARLRRAPRSPLPRAARRRRRASPRGPAGRRGGAAMSRARPPLYCPFCGDEDLRPVEDDDTAWSCRSCARLQRVPGEGRPRQHPREPPTGADRRPGMTTTASRVARPRRDPSARPPRAPPWSARRAPEPGPTPTSGGSRPPARRSAGPRDLREDLTSPAPWATRCCSTWSSTTVPAPTCSSSTPAPLRRDPRHPRCRTRRCSRSGCGRCCRCRPSPSRTRSTAQAARPQPRPVLRAAQGRAAGGAPSTTARGSPVCARGRPHAYRTSRSSGSTSGGAWSRSTPSPPGPRRTSRRYTQENGSSRTPAADRIRLHRVRAVHRRRRR